MSYKLLEEATTEDKMSNNSDLEPILWDIYARMGTIESSTQYLSTPLAVKIELEEIWNS